MAPLETTRTAPPEQVEIASEPITDSKLMSEQGHYFEDFAVGQTFAGRSRFTMTPEKIKAFAADYDPQTFHLDEQGALDTLFRGLAASGWHTAAITMRMMVESSLDVVGGLVGAGVEEVRWPRPTRPGDELHIEIEVMSVRELKSRPQDGMVKIKTVTRNQRNETVQILMANLLVPRRPVD